MKFSLKQIQIFQLVAELESVSEAAKRLHMSQSAASMALAQLETQLGNELFLRQGRRMELTNWGVWLRPHAHALLENCATIEQGMKDMDLVSGELRIGCSQTPAEHMLPHLIAELDHHFPRLKLRAEVENTEHVIEGLLDYRYDLGIIEGHCDNEDITRQTWCQDELVVIAGANHPYALQERCSFAQLDMAQWILREHGAGTREIFDTHMHEHLEQIKVHREYEQTNIILELVAEGTYLSCLSKRLVQSWLDSGRIKKLNVPELTMKRDISFIWRRQEAENSNRSAIIKTALKITD
ncbi:LysR substrate-binding domain-containing protein [Agaribacterium haliotis]|uniref:LysR substrate-binding domain-containing protein n=1 Tax=Agaribacterium haliotis TaxID=2013869 RepID=UPI000BB54296|nr:LysR substrate-binding domain-containing protein [Agaribacterium haliotis]